MSTYIILHHSATSPDTTFESVNRFHKEKWGLRSSRGFYTAYHYFIEQDGSITQAREDHESGPHAYGFNQEIGVCLAGNFSQTKPTEAQIQALTGLLKQKVKQYGIKPKNIVLHRNLPYNNTTCCGDLIPDDWGAQLVKKNLSLAERYKGKLIRNADSPKHYISNGEKIAHIRREIFDFGVSLGWFGDFDTVEVVEERIEEDVVL